MDGISFNIRMRIYRNYAALAIDFLSLKITLSNQNTRCHNFGKKSSSPLKKIKKMKRVMITIRMTMNTKMMMMTIYYYQILQIKEKNKRKQKKSFKEQRKKQNCQKWRKKLKTKKEFVTLLSLPERKKVKLTG